MGVKWPIGSLTPFKFKSDYSWQDFGAIFYAIDEYDVGMFIETGVFRGDLCSMMLLKCYYDDKFEYIGFTSDVESISNKERLAKFIEYSDNSWVHTGLLSNSPAYRLIISNKVKHNHRPVMMFCNSATYRADVDFSLSCMRCGDVIGTVFRETTDRDRFIVKYVKSGRLEKMSSELCSNDMFIGVVA